MSDLKIARKERRVAARKRQIIKGSLKVFLEKGFLQATTKEIAEAADMNAGELSRIESGRALPRDEDVPALERAYGMPVTSWYPAPVLLAVEFDEVWIEMLRERMHAAWRES